MLLPPCCSPRGAAPPASQPPSCSSSSLPCAAGSPANSQSTAVRCYCSSYSKGSKLAIPFQVYTNIHHPSKNHRKFCRAQKNVKLVLLNLF
uniref:Uncharacterized protein n=1 Tax=Arundo donax TaxID=35708 RepID=A0A0A9DRB9_ARUDO